MSSDNHSVHIRIEHFGLPPHDTTAGEMASLAGGVFPLSERVENALLRERIPYRIYGGQRFFERAEIKNAMAYMRLLDGRGNDSALERVINVPPRGIGEKTVEAIREHARQGGFPATRVSEVRAVIDPTTAERSPAQPMPR